MAKELNVGFLTVGFDPKWEVADVPIMPKNRYRRVSFACGFLWQHIPNVGSRSEVYIVVDFQGAPVT